MAGQQRRILDSGVVRRWFDSGLPAPIKILEDSMDTEDFERMEALEEKRDNCTITESEEKELTYLIWKYTN